jgi:hypothetical protein
MNRLLGGIAGLLLLASLCPAQQIGLPVLFLRYAGGVGSEAIEAEEAEEEEAEIETSAQRHRVTLRLKQQLGDTLVGNLYTALFRKHYFLQAGSYSYFYLNPDLAWEIGEGVKWFSAFRVKWSVYDELDAGGLPKDLGSLLFKTELAVRAMEELKLTPLLQGVFDLYDNEAKSRQTYTGGLSLEARLGGDLRLSGRYRGTLRLPLGPASTVGERFDHEFGVNLSWDPNP